MTEAYIEAHFAEIIGHESEIEARLEAADCTIEGLKTDNRRYLEAFSCAGERVARIEGDYESTLKQLTDRLTDELLKGKPTEKIKGES